MKYMTNFAVVLMLLLAGSVIAAQTNPAGVNRLPQADISNPAGMGTVMPSTYRRPTRQSQDIYAGGGAGNLIVTGDVAGGRQFRGIIPYSSLSGFSARTGSESVDAFLRSTQSTGYGGTPGATQAYYAPSRTVSRLPSSGIAGSGTAAQVGAPLDALAPVQARPAGSDLLDLASQYRPLAKTPLEMFDVVSKQTPASQAETMLLKAINDIRQKELIKELESIKNKAAEIARADLEQAPKTGIVEPDKPAGIEPLATPDRTTPESPTAKPVDIYDRMLQQLDKDFEEYMEKRQADSLAADAKKPADASPNVSPDAFPDDPDGKPSNEKTRLDDMLHAVRAGGKINPEELNAEGYKLYMDLGAEYMAQKKFYRAAETFALARVYRSDQASSFAGQSWALFATGEYMSSAYYLGRAIELDPNAAAKKVDLAAMIGKETADQRQADLNTWQQRTYSSEMQFLLAYVDHQMGRTRDAEDNIRAASLKMEDYKPAALLREIILGGQL